MRPHYPHMQNVGANSIKRIFLLLKILMTAYDYIMLIKNIIINNDNICQDDVDCELWL